MLAPTLMVKISRREGEGYLVSVYSLLDCFGGLWRAFKPLWCDSRNHNKRDYSNDPSCCAILNFPVGFSAYLSMLVRWMVCHADECSLCLSVATLTPFSSHFYVVAKRPIPETFVNVVRSDFNSLENSPLQFGVQCPFMQCNAVRVYSNVGLDL